MLVLCAIVNEEVVHQRTTERALWQHTLDSVTKDLVHSVWALAQLSWCVEALTTWITSVTCVNLIGLLLTRENYLSGVDMITLSPQSTCGVKVGLYLPRSNLATFEQRRPTTWSVASITTHSFLAVSLFTEIVLKLNVSILKFKLLLKNVFNLFIHFG